MLKWLDTPPVWLAGALGVAWVQSARFDAGLRFGGGVVDLLGGLLVGGGLLLIALAVTEMRRQRTTVLPHMQASHLVTTGIFKRSRNPIYLGDSLILLGCLLTWDAALSLPLVPLFIWMIERRFIVPEENRLRRQFRADFARYCQKTRRWA